jgi:ankyrin repeat protein
MDKFINNNNKSNNKSYSSIVDNDQKSSSSYTTVCSNFNNNDENNNKEKLTAQQQHDKFDDQDDFDTNNNDQVSTELHYLVFHNKINDLQRYIDQNKKNLDKLSIQDRHGNTPLHLACMLGHIDIVRRLIHANSKVKIRNKQMWTPLNEAISYGNRELSKLK